MASSGTISKKITDWLRLDAVWSITSQSLDELYSNVKVEAKLVNTSSNGYVNSSVNKAIIFKVNGETRSFASAVSVSSSPNSTKTLKTETFKIPHNADGTKTISISIDVHFNVELSGVHYSVVTVSGNATLNTIAIRSTVTRSGTATLGQEQTLTITRLSSAYTHTLKYTWGGTTTELATGVTTSYKWTPPVSMATKIPKATSGTCKLTVYTYNGSKLIGSYSISFTLSVPSSVVPTISAFTLTEALSGVAETFGSLKASGVDYGAFVNTKSKIKYAVTASGAQGSTISSYLVSIAGQKFTKASATTAVIAPGAGTKTATVTVTDSRGRTATKSVTFTVIGYTPPYITKFKVNRCDIVTGEDGTTSAVVNESGENLYLTLAFSITYASGKNPYSYSLQYKQADADDSAYTDLPFNFTGYSYNDTVFFETPTLPKESTFAIRFKVDDFFHSISQTVELSSARPIIDIHYSGSGMAFNKMSEIPDLLDIGYKTRFYGGIQPMIIVASTDFNDLTTPNIYASGVTPASGAFKNCPITDDVAFMLEVLPTGSSGQVLQRFTVCSKEYSRVYERHYYQSAWGNWYATYNGQKGKKLWSGALYMGLKADKTRQIAPLDEPISKQPNGIVLIFSEYVDGSAVDYGWQHFFISKYFPITYPTGSNGSGFIMSNSNFNYIANKYIYIYDDRLEGNENNTKTGTGNSGITFTNNRYVLRYVIGV